MVFGGPWAPGANPRFRLDPRNLRREAHLLPSVDREQTFDRLVPQIYPFSVFTSAAHGSAYARISVIFRLRRQREIKRPDDSQELPTEDDEVRDRQGIPRRGGQCRWFGGGEELIVTHCRQSLGVEIEEEDERWD